MKSDEGGYPAWYGAIARRPEKVVGYPAWYGAIARRPEKVVKPAPEPPRIIEPQRTVEVDELPRGAKTVAAKVSDRWFTRWSRTMAEVLTEPKRGGETVGVSFAHETDGRHGWAAWNSETGFLGGFLYDPHDRERVLVQKTHAGQRLIPLPRRLKAKELKEVLADG